MYRKSEGQITHLNKVVEVLGDDLHHELLDIKDKIKLDRTFFRYYNRCFIANKVLSKHNFFIKFLKGETIIGFLSKRKLPLRIQLQEIFQSLSSKNLMDMKT